MANCDEVVRRNSGTTAPEGLEAVATALVNKGTVLVDLDRLDEALAAWDEVVQRFEHSEVPLLRYASETALLKKAALERVNGRSAAAIDLVDSLLGPESAGFTDIRLHGHIIRARAFVAEGNTEVGARDVETVLAILPELGSIPKTALDGLIGLSVDLGAAKMRDLIRASPASDLLLPLTTALEMELGEEPRVAKEVEEVAEDILRDLIELREGRSGDGGAASLDPGSRPG